MIPEETTTTTMPAQESRWRDSWLVVGALLGPTAWFALLVGAYWAVPGAHEHGREWLLRGMHGGAALLALISVGISIRELIKTTGTADDMIVQRRRFVALVGFGVSLLSLLVILGMSVATFMLATGAEP